MAVAYIGAGGGGDTNAAIMCALADTSSSEKFVLGAGYSIQEYKDSFAKQQNSRKVKGQIDRKSVTNPQLTVDYLNESLKNYLDENADNLKTSVWRLNDTEKESMEALFNNVKPDTTVLNYDNPDIQKQYSSYKYQALLEERLLLRKLKADLGNNAVLNNIYMFFSTSSWDNNNAINTSYNALKDFIINKNIQKLVLMDFGGDLIEFTKPGRDPIVLLNCLRLLQDKDIQNLTVEVWIYGAGVDSHALPNDVINNLKKFQQITGTPEEIVTVNTDPLIDFIKNKSALLDEIDILGLNRATGNWYEAYKNCLKLGGARRKNNKRGGGVTVEAYIKDGLQARSEYDSLKTPELKAIMDNGWMTFFESSADPWCTLANTYKFAFTSPLNDSFWNAVKNIQPKFTLDLQKSTLGGGKPKDLKKTNEKVKVGSRDAVVYATPRGAKYVVIKGSYVKVKDIAKTLKKSTKK
jgi:hypothetical protein